MCLDFGLECFLTTSRLLSNANVFGCFLRIVDDCWVVIWTACFSRLTDEATLLLTTLFIGVVITFF